MKAKAAQPLGDVLARTQEFHRHLAESMDTSANKSDDPRAQLLMNYLRDHELKLEKAIHKLEEAADEEDLRTWFYDYAQPNNVLSANPPHKPFSEMTSEELIGEIANQHRQVVEFYRYLYGRAGGTHAREILRELIDFEQTEAQLISYEGGRVEEM